jgi:hypothetical protein
MKDIEWFVAVVRNECIEVVPAEAQFGADLHVSDSLLCAEASYVPLRGVEVGGSLPAIEKSSSCRNWCSITHLPLLFDLS